MPKTYLDAVNESEAKYFAGDLIKKRKRDSVDDIQLVEKNGDLEEKKLSSARIPLSKKRRIMAKRSRKLPKLSNPFNTPWVKSLPKGVLGDSEVEGRNVFEAMIRPVGVNHFLKNIWEKQPLLIKRHNVKFNKGLFSTSELDSILRRERLNFSENIDVVTYVDDERKTHNPDGRAVAAVVWDFYQQGCSVRLLNPQTYSKKVWSVLSLLQEFFGCMAGANVYLTPPGTQGFAPHWDDIEAFIIQLEGKKHWKIYEPRSEEETLPTFSSNNFTSADIGEPVLETTLHAGDLLYFPKGFIHQGKTEDTHSLHITISVGQKNTWGDFLKTVLPRALEVAMEEDVEFRKSLPRNYLSFMGLSFEDEEANEFKREEFLGKLKGLFNKIWKHAPFDAAADQMAKNYLESSLPPCLTKAEKALSIFGQGEVWNPNLKEVVELAEIEPDTMIRIIRRGSVRLLSEDKVCIYHNLENARVYQGSEFKCIEIDDEEADAVECLLKAYPAFVKVDELPLPSLEQQISIARLLYDKGLVMTRGPLKCFDDDGHDCSDCSCCSEDENGDEGEDRDDDDDDDEEEEEVVDGSDAAADGSDDDSQ